MYISGILGAKSPGRIEPKFFLEEDIPDVITCFKFGDDRFRGLASAEGQILPFPIDFDGRPYNTLTLPCERVMSYKWFHHSSICYFLTSCECLFALICSFKYSAVNALLSGPNKTTPLKPLYIFTRATLC